MSSRGSSPPHVPLADRVVEVIADLGESVKPRYRYGSGLIVRGRAVLTAAHVVAEAANVQVRDPEKNLYRASVDPRFVGDPAGPAPDLALVEIEDEGVDLPQLGLARVNRDSPTADPVERCHAIGYPWFAETPSPRTTRETVDAMGLVPVLSGLARGLLSVEVTASPRSLPREQESLGESEWSGMSGAPVVAAGLLLGVVIEHAPREGPSSITAVPLTALESDPAHSGWGPGVADPFAWWSRLGVAGLDDLKRLPAPPERPAPPYRATLRELGQALHQRMPQLLGRQDELGEIAAFATGAGRYRWLVGGAYTGKTALLFEAVMVGLPAEVDVVSYFLSRRASDADSNRFLAAVVPQLAYLCEVDSPPTPGRDELNDLWQKANDQAEESGRRLLLVVDGLDEDSHPPGSASVASMLPKLVGANAHVLVASRPHPELPVDVDDSHPLRATRPVELAPFEGASELAALARQEIDDLTRGDDLELAVDVLGLLAAAAGPLAVRDLAELSNSAAASSPAHRRQVRAFVTERAGRSLEPVGSDDHRRYQFAHYSLLEYAQKNEDLADPEFRGRINGWAEQWRDRGWPTTTDAITTTPRYLLDAYPSTLAGDPERLAALVTDPVWVDAAIQSVGVDRVLADLRSASDAAPAKEGVSAMLAVVRGQAHNLSPADPLAEPGYVSRQLWLQAAALNEDRIADKVRSRLQAQPGRGPVPLWTTRRVSRALLRELARSHIFAAAVALADGRVASGDFEGRVLLWELAETAAQPVELGRHDNWVGAVAALEGGGLVSGGADGRVLLWDPAGAGSQPVELGRHEGWATALAALPDGRVVSGGSDGRVLLWDSAEAGPRRVELGRHGGEVRALAVLPDGRVVSGSADDQRVLVWEVARAGAEPVELGRHDGWVSVVAVLEDGRVVSGASDGRLLVWDAALAGSRPVELGRLDGPVSALAMLADGRVVTGGADDRRVLLWQVTEAGFQPVELGRHDGPVSPVVALPDGRVVSGGSDGRVLVWDAAHAGSHPVERGRGSDPVTAVAVAGLADGRVVSVGGDDSRVLLWNPTEADSEPVELGRHDGGWVGAVAGLPDGRVVSASNDGRVLVWRAAETGSRPVELGSHDDAVTAVAGLRDGRVAVGGSDGSVLLWDAAEAGSQPIVLGRHDGAVDAMAVLEHGRVVSGGADGRVLIWNAAEAGSQPVELGRHDRPHAVSGRAVVAVVPDGRVVSGGAEGRVLLWDPAKAGSQPVDLGRHDGFVTALAVLPEERVVSAGADARVRLWDVTAHSEIARLGASSTALAAEHLDRDGTSLVIAHSGGGLSFWSFAARALVSG